MRTFRDDIITIMVNSDWSGDAIVTARISGLYVGGGEELFEWIVKPADVLLSGNLGLHHTFQALKAGNDVPPWLVARAVALAVRSKIQDELSELIEGLTSRMKVLGQ